jgi:hypothetical protein
MSINTFLEPVDQFISSQGKCAAFLARHAPCFSTRAAFESARILLSSGFFVIQSRDDESLNLQVLQSCSLHKTAVALKSCGTGISPLHIFTLLAHSMQPSIALEIVARPKETMDPELDEIARRLIQQYYHSGTVATSELVARKKLMESMAAASQVVAPSSAGSDLPHQLPPVTVKMGGDAASETNSDGTSDVDADDERGPALRRRRNLDGCAAQ